MGLDGGKHRVWAPSKLGRVQGARRGWLEACTGLKVQWPLLSGCICFACRG